MTSWYEVEVKNWKTGNSWRQTEADGVTPKRMTKDEAEAEARKYGRYETVKYPGRRVAKVVAPRYSATVVPMSDEQPA